MESGSDPKPSFKNNECEEKSGADAFLRLIANGTAMTFNN